MKTFFAALVLGVGAFGLSASATAADDAKLPSPVSATPVATPETKPGAPSSLETVTELQVKSTPETRAAAEKDRKRAAADYKKAREQCEALDGNKRDICQAQARLSRVETEAKADAIIKNTSSARRQALVDIAKAKYDLAEEKCDDLKGDAKDKCQDQARLERAKATMESTTQEKAGDAMEPRGLQQTERAGSRGGPAANPK